MDALEQIYVLQFMLVRQPPNAGNQQKRFHKSRTGIVKQQGENMSTMHMHRK